MFPLSKGIPIKICGTEIQILEDTLNSPNRREVNVQNMEDSEEAGFHGGPYKTVRIHLVGGSTLLVDGRI
jgi:hypothetical protein